MKRGLALMSYSQKMEEYKDINCKLDSVTFKDLGHALFSKKKLKPLDSNV